MSLFIDLFNSLFLYVVVSFGISLCCDVVIACVRSLCMPLVVLYLFRPSVRPLVLSLCIIGVFVFR